MDKMGCGGCHKKSIYTKTTQSVKTIQQKPIQTTNKTNWKPATSRQISNQYSLCPLCKSVLRIINRFDSNSRIVIKTYECSNPKCTNK